jgi:antitoxin component YwqK of YwqJK toxin-antitoxin module
MIAFPKSKKMKLLTILLLVFHLTPCYTYAQDNWTERDWANYAKAQAYSYEFNIKSVDAVFAEKNKTFRDSIAAFDVFTSFVIDGHKYKETDCKPTELDGLIRYFYANGQIASEKSFKNNKPDGKEIYYLPTGEIAEKVNYIAALKDTAIFYYSNGQVAKMNIFNFNMIDQSFMYWSTGELAEKDTWDWEGQEDKVTEFNPSSKSVEIVNYFDTSKKEHFDKSGKKISQAEFEMLMRSENAKRVVLPLNKPDADSSDQEVLNKFHAKWRNERNRFIKQNDVLQCLRNYSGDSIGNQILKKNSNVIRHPQFPNALYLDTVWYQSEGDIFRVAKQSKGQLNGRLSYFYPGNKKLAEANFKGDLIDGYFFIYYNNGNIQFKEKYSLGEQIDTAFAYGLEGDLTYFKVFLDSGKYVRTFYWEDAKTIQRIEKCSRVYYKIDRSRMPRQVFRVPELSLNYFDKMGVEISEKKFRELYPDVLPQRTRLKF